MNDDLISRQAAIDALMKRDKELRNINWYDKPFAEGECKGIDYALEIVNALPSVQPTQSNASNALKTLDCIDRQSAIDAIDEIESEVADGYGYQYEKWRKYFCELPSAQPDIEKICTRIKAETIKRNVEYMKHGDRYMLGFVDGMRLARRIVDGTIDDPVYFTLSGE